MFEILQRIFLINLLWNYLIYMTASQFCNQDSLSKCAKDVVQDPIDNLTLINVNESYLNDFCGKYKSFSYCYKELRPRCFGLDSLLASYDGIDKANNYLCETNKNEYFQQINCYKDEVVNKLCNNCKNNLDILIVSIQNLDPKGKIINYCKFIDLYLQCLENVLKNLCPSSSLNWAITYNKYLVEPVMRLYECPGWIDKEIPGNQIDKTVLLVSIIMSVVAFLAILVTCLVLITKTSCCRICLSKCKAENTSLENGSVPAETSAPPSYEGLVRLQQIWKQLSSSPDEESSCTTVDFSTDNTHSVGTSGNSNSVFLGCPSHENKIQRQENQTNLKKSTSFFNSDQSLDKNYKNKAKKSKNKKEKLGGKFEEDSNERTINSSVFTTDASGEEASFDRRHNNAFTTYKGSSELSVYAHVHKFSDFKRNVSRT